jgi:hypothetical protein
VNGRVTIPDTNPLASDVRPYRLRIGSQADKSRRDTARSCFGPIAPDRTRFEPSLKSPQCSAGFVRG